jgi:hypothetical protein
MNHKYYYPIISYKISTYKRFRLPDMKKKLKSVKFTLLDGSSGLHISEQKVSISYTFR